MHQVFSTVVRPLLEATHGQAILEVGAGAGRLTRRLIENSDAVVYAVDPEPLFDPRALTHDPDRLVLYRKRSVSVLRGLPPLGLAILDGDPNYYTISRELSQLAASGKSSAPAPVIVVHNVGWPFARRDGYHDPESIPPPERVQCTAMGLIPGHSAPSPEGIELVPFVAEQERLPRTGVLTAIEDFLDAHPGAWRSIQLPGLHGIAVLAACDRLESDEQLASVLDSFERPEFLIALVDSIERERIAALVRGPVAVATSHDRNGAELGSPVAARSDAITGLDEIDAERLDALQTRLELLERDRDDRLRLLEDERSELLRRATEAQVRLEAGGAELQRANRRLAELEQAASVGAADVKRLAADVQSETKRAQRGERSLEQAHDEIKQLRAQLDSQTTAWLTERAMIGEYVDRAAGSRAWRIGHRITTVGSRITFRRNLGTSALGKLQQRLASAPDELTNGAHQTRALTTGSEPEPSAHR